MHRAPSTSLDLRDLFDGDLPNVFLFDLYVLFALLFIFQ